MKKIRYHLIKMMTTQNMIHLKYNLSKTILKESQKIVTHNSMESLSILDRGYHLEKVKLSSTKWLELILNLNKSKAINTSSITSRRRINQQLTNQWLNHLILREFKWNITLQWVARILLWVMLQLGDILRVSEAQVADRG